MNWLLSNFVMAAAICLCAAQCVTATGSKQQEADALQPVNDIEWREMTIQVIDPEDRPVVDAVVQPWALRGNGRGNPHMPWLPEVRGTPRQTKTDHEGKTQIIYPRGTGEQTGLTSHVSVMVKHPDFCSNDSEVNVLADNSPQVQQIRLRRGVRLRIAGIKPGTQIPLPHCHVLIENNEDSYPEFRTQPDGWLQTVPLSEDRKWFRVIYAPPDGPLQFSNPRAWNSDDPDSRTALVEVRPGVRVIGRVSNTAARPVKAGRVVAWCGSKSHSEQVQQVPTTRPIFWIETTNITAEGTFEFSSLPSGYLAQFYATTGDAVSAQPTDEAYEVCCKWFQVPQKEFHPRFRYGQVVRLVGASMQVTLDMEEASRIQVVCVDETNRPIEGIKIQGWPNQQIVGAGSTVFCGEHSSLTQLLRPRAPYEAWWKEDLFGAETNAKGEAVITGLPAGSHFIAASGDEWQESQKDHVVVESGKSTTVELILKRTP